MQVDHVLDESSSVSSGVAFQTVCASLAEHLASRTYFVGHYLTIADLAVWGQLFSARQWDSIKKLPAHSNIVRWLDLCSMNETVAQITSEALANRPGAKRAVAQADKLERNPKSVGGKDTGGSFDIDLEGASEGNVVTRFPPEPSGYLQLF